MWSPYPVCGKWAEVICNPNYFCSMVTPVSLPPECCTSLMFLLHLLWMNTPVPKRAVLCPIDVKVCFCFSQFLIQCSPGLVDRDKLPLFVFDLAQLLDELVDTVVARQRARVFLDHRDCDHVVVVVLVGDASLFSDVAHTANSPICSPMPSRSW